MSGDAETTVCRADTGEQYLLVVQLAENFYRVGQRRRHSSRAYRMGRLSNNTLRRATPLVPDIK